MKLLEVKIDKKNESHNSSHKDGLGGGGVGWSGLDGLENNMIKKRTNIDAGNIDSVLGGRERTDKMNNRVNEGYKNQRETVSGLGEEKVHGEWAYNFNSKAVCNNDRIDGVGGNDENMRFNSNNMTNNVDNNNIINGIINKDNTLSNDNDKSAIKVVRRECDGFDEMDSRTSGEYKKEFAKLLNALNTVEDTLGSSRKMTNSVMAISDGMTKDNRMTVGWNEEDKYYDHIRNNEIANGNHSSVNEGYSKGLNEGMGGLTSGGMGEGMNVLNYLKDIDYYFKKYGNDDFSLSQMKTNEMDGGIGERRGNVFDDNMNLSNHMNSFNGNKKSLHEDGLTVGGVNRGSITSLRKGVSWMEGNNRYTSVGNNMNILKSSWLDGEKNESEGLMNKQGNINVLSQHAGMMGMDGRGGYSKYAVDDIHQNYTMANPGNSDMLFRTTDNNMTDIYKINVNNNKLDGEGDSDGSEIVNLKVGENVKQDVPSPLTLLRTPFFGNPPNSNLNVSTESFGQKKIRVGTDENY